MRPNAMSATMTCDRPGGYRAGLAVWGAALLCLGACTVRGSDVSGVVRMPDVCSPAASPSRGLFDRAVSRHAHGHVFSFGSRLGPRRMKRELQLSRW